MKTIQNKNLINENIELKEEIKRRQVERDYLKDKIQELRKDKIELLKWKLIHSNSAPEKPVIPYNRYDVESNFYSYTNLSFDAIIEVLKDFEKIRLTEWIKINRIEI